MTSRRKSLIPSVILIACSLTTFATAAFANEREQLLREQLRHEQLLHKQLQLQLLREQLRHEQMLHKQLLLQHGRRRHEQAMAKPRKSQPLREMPIQLRPEDIAATMPAAGQIARQQGYASQQQAQIPSPVIRVRQQAVPQQISLATREGIDLGVQISYYEYREQKADDNLFIYDWGYKGGVEAAFTQTIPDNWFIRGEGRYARGTVDYLGGTFAGNKLTITGIPEHTWEVRGLAGRDFLWNNFSLSPYAGYGYRYLWDDPGAGTPSIPSWGYRRESQYHYIPLGLTNRVRLGDQLRLSTNLEYDYFLRGTQKSYLSDGPAGDPDILNPQHSGEGARGSVLFETALWSVGPWFNYWHIGRSELHPVCVPSGCGFHEPDNTTTEFGFKVVRKIW